MHFTLPGTIRLKSSAQIGSVFVYGSTVRTKTLLAHFRLVPAAQTDSPPVKAAFAVSKKKFKKSVDRNYIKRLMRECYRTRKTLLPTSFPLPMQLHLVISYTHPQKPNYHAMCQEMNELLPKVHAKLDNYHAQ